MTDEKMRVSNYDRAEQKGLISSCMKRPRTTSQLRTTHTLTTAITNEILREFLLSTAYSRTRTFTSIHMLFLTKYHVQQ